MIPSNVISHYIMNYYSDSYLNLIKYNNFFNSKIIFNNLLKDLKNKNKKLLNCYIVKAWNLFSDMQKSIIIDNFLNKKISIKLIINCIIKDDVKYFDSILQKSKTKLNKFIINKILANYSMCIFFNSQELYYVMGTLYINLPFFLKKIQCEKQHYIKKYYPEFVYVYGRESHYDFYKFSPTEIFFIIDNFINSKEYVPSRGYISLNTYNILLNYINNIITWGSSKRNIHYIDDILEFENIINIFLNMKHESSSISTPPTGSFWHIYNYLTVTQNHKNIMELDIKDRLNNEKYFLYILDFLSNENTKLLLLFIEDEISVMNLYNLLITTKNKNLLSLWAVLENRFETHLLTLGINRFYNLVRYNTIMLLLDRKEIIFYYFNKNSFLLEKNNKKVHYLKNLI